MTSVAQIAEALQLSKGTIMYHFGAKDQLLKQMSLEYMQRRLHELEVIVESVPTSEGRLYALIASLVTSYGDDRAASVAFSREFMRFANEPVMEDVRTLRRRYVDALQELLEGGMTDGVFRRTDAKIVALQIIGMCTWTWTWLQPDGRLAFDEVAAIFADTVLDGVLADAQSDRAPRRLPEAITELRRSAADASAPG